MSAVGHFQQVMSDAGLGTPEIITDGLLHRFHVDGDRSGTRNGWYIFYVDKVCGGCFGSWKLGTSETWHENGKSLSDTQLRQMKAKIVQNTRRRKQELEFTQLKAAEDAQAMWNQSADDLFHPYLKNKRVLPFGVRQRNDYLIIPLRDTDGKIWSYQSIDSSGRKMFMKGGKVAGNFYQIGEITNQVYIAEGFATAATLNQELNVPAVVAFNAKNLKPVAKAIAQKYPLADIIIAADNDKSEGNPGLTSGREAASAVGAKIIYPTFDDLGDGSDFNDYVNAGGVL